MKKYYYGVIYLKNGSCCICSACESEEEVLEEMRKAVSREIASHNPPIRTTYMTRNAEDGEAAPTLMDILGKPNSRDLMQDKKFLKEIM